MTCQQHKSVGHFFFYFNLKILGHFVSFIKCELLRREPTVFLSIVYLLTVFLSIPLNKYLEGINETQTNQPMERIKKLVEDTAKLNNYMQEIDVHLEGVDKKVNEEIPRNLLLNKMFTKLGKLSRYIFQCRRRI